MTVEKTPALIVFFELLLGDFKVDILDAPLDRSIIDALIFSEMWGVEVVHISGKFHLHMACGFWVFSLQMFSKQQKAVKIIPLTPLSFPLEE